MAVISYVPTFQHQDWIDNVDRVQAGGDNGFNLRFHALEAEFNRLAGVITQLSAALQALGQQPPPQQLAATFTPELVPTAANGWTHLAGLAQKPPTQTGAQGMMSVTIPHGARIQSLRVSGRNSGAGNLRIILQRQDISTNASPADRVAHIETTGDPFDMTAAADAQFATVDTTRFKYFVVAQLDNAQAADTVQLAVFQISYLA